MSTPRRLRPSAGQILTVLVILAVVTVVAMIAFLKKPAAPDLVVPERAHPVRVVAVSGDPVRDPLELPARIEPRYEAVLAAEKPGRIEEIAVERGARVREGDVLARLDARVWEARLRQAEVEERIAAREMERWNELKAAGAVSGSDFDAIQARLERAEAAVTDARALADQCIVRAPADGIISERFAEPGEFANEGMALLRLTDVSSVKIVADVPERDIGTTSPGADITFTVDRLPGDIFTASLVFISPSARRDTNTFRVEATVPNPDGRIRGGMIARLRWPRRPVEGWISLPLPAVIPRRGEHVVFLADANNRAVRREVILEYVAGPRAVVSAGVAPGERLVVDGQRSLSDGVLLEVLDGAPVPAEEP